MVREAIAWLDRTLPLSARFPKGAINREDRLPVPAEALREIVINAVIHRDVSNPSSYVAIAVFDDRIEVRSIGDFPSGVAEHHWEVAGADAYPWLVAVDEDLVARPPTAEEVTIAEAVALALPKVLEEKRRLLAAWNGGEPFARTLVVATHAGDVEVSLRVPYEREPNEYKPPYDVLAELFELGRNSHRIDAEARRPLEDELVRRFVASPEAKTLTDVQSCHFVMDFAADYFNATIATLGPRELREIVFDIIPRKVSIDASAASWIIEENRAFYAFLKREFGLEQADACLRVFGGDAVKKLEVALSDTSKFGMAKSLFMGGREAGFDMDSKEGIEAWMRVMQSPAPAGVRPSAVTRVRSAAAGQDRSARKEECSQGCPQGAQEEPMTRRDPYSWTVVRLPERDLAELILEFAAPLLERLGPAPAGDDARAAVALAVSFWNASVLASKRWEHPRVKELNALKKNMRGRTASREDAARFDLLTERWSEHWLDPRLVESWTYEPDAAGVPRLVCTTGLPEGVRAEIPPPAEKRVAIGGKFLDEVQISQGGNMSLSFPVDRHRGVVGDDGTATVYPMMPSALKLFAEGRLPRVGGDPVEVAIGGRKLGPMVLTEVRCGGENYRHDIAVLVFRRGGAEGSR